MYVGSNAHAGRFHACREISNCDRLNSGIGLGIATAFAEQKINVMLNGFGDQDAIEKLRKELAAKHGVKIAYSPADIKAARHSWDDRGYAA